MPLRNLHSSLSIADRFAEVVLVEDAERGGRPVKHILLALGMTLAISFGAPIAIGGLAFLYMLWDYGYAWHVGKMRKQIEISARRYALILAHHFLNVGAFASMAVYISTFDWAWAPMTATIFLTAQAFHNLAFTSRSRDQLISTSFVLTVAAQLTARSFIVADDGMGIWLFVHGALGLISVFGALAAWQTYQVQAALAETRAELLTARRGETIGRLNAGIAHDFRNLLTVMRGNLDLVREVDEAEREALLHEVRQATERGEHLAAKLLLASRNSAFQAERVNLAEFLHQFMAFAERVIPSNVALRLAEVPKDLALHVDATELEAALLNLVLNARDALKTGGEVVIRATRNARSDAIEIAVDDNGPGMPVALRERVTEARVTTKAPGQGAGLGLTMVREFVEASGGTLNIASTPNRGTRISLNLPL